MFFADCQEFFEIAVEFISAFSAKKLAFCRNSHFAQPPGKPELSLGQNRPGLHKKNTGASPAFFKGLSKASGC